MVVEELAYKSSIRYLRDVYGESSAFVWPCNMSYQPTFIHSVDKNLVLSRAVYGRKKSQKKGIQNISFL
jgi:hypothetical protein